MSAYGFPVPQPLESVLRQNTGMLPHLYIARERGQHTGSSEQDHEKDAAYKTQHTTGASTAAMSTSEPIVVHAVISNRELYWLDHTTLSAQHLQTEKLPHLYTVDKVEIYTA